MRSFSKIEQPKFLLIFICIFFLFTRLYQINEIPPSVYWDEASIGYNAYAVSETGRDEWGKFLPIHFRAFGEFKLPVYIYSTAIFVKVFGLNEFSVRFPSVLFSLGTVILIYLLAKRLSGSKMIGILSSFLVSVSPWFFIFSRTGYEVTAGLMFYLLAIYLFLGLRVNVWHAVFSVVSFILSAYSYNSFRIIAPLTILVLITYEFRGLKVVFKKGVLPLILSGIILLLSVFPIYRLYRYDAGSIRLQVISTTNSKFAGNYLSHFSPNFLFISGDKNLRSQQSGFGQLYLPELILLPLGLVYMFKSKSKYSFLSLALLLLGPIPAAITKESPHALRAISSIPFFSVISAMGIVCFQNIFRNKYFVGFTAVVIFFVFFINYFINFLTVFPAQSSKDWQYGYKKIFTDFKNDFPKYNQIFISDEYAQPYIFALFYQKVDPNKFRQTAIRNNVSEWGFSTVASFDKFKFGKINQLLKTRNLGSSLIFASDKEKINGLNPIGEVKLLDGTNAFWVYSK